MSSNPIDRLQQNVNDFLQSKGLQTAGNPLSSLIRQSLQDMEFVSLEDFETQREILERLRTRVRELEARLQELESKS